MRTRDGENRSLICTSHLLSQNHSPASTPCTLQSNSVFPLYRYGSSKMTKEIAKNSKVNLGNTLKCATSKNPHRFQDHSIFIAHVL